MKVNGQELKNCRVCGQVPEVEKLADDGLRIGCAGDDPTQHKCIIESEPAQYAIDTWNTLQGGAK